VKRDVPKPKLFLLVAIGSVLWIGFSIYFAVGYRARGPAAPPPSASQYLKVVRANWQRGGFGNVSLWSVLFKNESNRPVGNIRYVIYYYSETGGHVGMLKQATERILQKVIPPGEYRILSIDDGLIDSQAHKAEFVVNGCEYVADLR
jgi:hypothetical protein